jgi:hypothetical protein
MKLVQSQECVIKKKQILECSFFNGTVIKNSYQITKRLFDKLSFSLRKKGHDWL